MRPWPMATWDSVLECAEWDLRRAEATKQQDRVTALLKTIAYAKQRIACGDRFPIRRAEMPYASN